ncbi:UDP-D-apiose/UDP-D-xylose synthase 1-like [Mangifera indica]|uniref:UDP-D-apiose/UDP-D-xylose synthase 1-like n=1 Tax=Mangifera indica TaxID=29780 RepID=UPI001CFA3214|nr:UDP-D-apiose/UDP-D-xylose synthase 1-like [Mangifera indica]
MALNSARSSFTKLNILPCIVIDISSTKIKHLLRPYYCWIGRVQFHEFGVKRDILHQHLEPLIAASDLVINLAAICTPADYINRPFDAIYSNFIDAIPVNLLASAMSRMPLKLFF